MGFEDMSEFEPVDGMLCYWLPVHPFSKVAIDNHPWTEIRHLLTSVLRQLDTDEQRKTFRELTGW